jgi:phospholipase C
MCQSSILKFIEDNWHTSRIGGGSLDVGARSITGMCNFSRPQQQAALLAANGTVAATATGPRLLRRRGG